MGLQSDLLRIPAREQARLIAGGEITSVELCEATLDRIEALDHQIGAFITVSHDQALSAARQADRRALDGDTRSPLDGVPIGVKDIEATKGIRTTLGSRRFENHIPEFDSVVVERVKAAGLVIIGKTNTPEIAIHMDTITDNEVRGPCRNPWNTDRTTSGSSGGSAAAVAADMCQIAIGSDGGGSIRIPAAFCGVFGLKPTGGRVPRARGLGHPDPNQFAQSGPITNDVRDAAVLLQAIAGPHDLDPQPFLRSDPPFFSSGTERGIEGLTFGYSPDFGYAAVDPNVLERVEASVGALESAGARVQELDLALSEELASHFWRIFGANAYVQYGHLIEEHPEELTDGVRQVLENGRQIAGFEYGESLRTVYNLRQYIDRQFDEVDIMVSPTTAVTAFEPDNRPAEIAGRDVGSVYGLFPFTYIFNMTGHPAAFVPCGFADGLPVGLQIAGRFGDEASVFQAAAALETAAPWISNRPLP